ncbi:hypothetical protein ARMGADRAFT_591837 [Armillaria gallica]|uniref:Secreted protein n=1 Tax=Armillaria gallica TaxID=47427 RepID=A0A2H3CTC0_ARMGA|nr:hypothetical protein ARMGADRAFT_591837 [Armillaria gallica]
MKWRWSTNSTMLALSFFFMGNAPTRASRTILLVQCDHSILRTHLFQPGTISWPSLRSTVRTHSATITPEFGSFQPAGDGPKFVYPNKRFNSNDSESAPGG